MKFQDFISEITEEILTNNKKVTFFVGTGFSMWFSYPSWNCMFYDFCDKLTAEYISQKIFINEIRSKVEDGYYIPKAFNDILEQLGLDGEYLKDFVVKYFREIERVNNNEKFRDDDLDLIKYRELFELSKNYKIITTNFDTLIEDIFLEKYNIKSKIFYSDHKSLDKHFFCKDKNNYSILKLHGDINRKEVSVKFDPYTTIAPCVVKSYH